MQFVLIDRLNPIKLHFIVRTIWLKYLYQTISLYALAHNRRSKQVIFWNNTPIFKRIFQYNVANDCWTYGRVQSRKTRKLYEIHMNVAESTEQTTNIRQTDLCARVTDFTQRIRIQLIHIDSLTIINKYSENFRCLSGGDIKILLRSCMRSNCFSLLTRWIHLPVSIVHQL